jgi:transcriptional regulator with XRE-family HTH domain
LSKGRKGLSGNIENTEHEFIKNDRIIAIHQPNFIPWLGYFYKIYQSDIFVFADDLQYSNKGMQNYCYIKTSQGPVKLIIPVRQSLGDKINEVRIKDEPRWKERHLKTIEYNYRKAKKFNKFFFDYAELIGKDYPNLALMNITMIKFIAEKLGITTRYINSSELNINDQREERIFQICNALDATIYYSGIGAKAYQNEEHFKSRGLELSYSNFTPFEYPQLWLWHGFQSNVSVLDFLLNCGYDWELVLRNQKEDLKKKV